MGKKKLYRGIFSVKLTGINGTPTIPVINGIASLEIKNMQMVISKISDEQCRLQLTLSIPQVNLYNQTYETIGLYLNCGKVIVFNASIFYQGKNVLTLSEGKIKFDSNNGDDFKVKAIGYSNIITNAGTIANGSGYGKFKKEC